MRTLSVEQALLVALFRAARAGEPVDLEVLAMRWRMAPAVLQNETERLVRKGWLGPDGRRLSLQGVCLAAALDAHVRQHLPVPVRRAA